MVSRKHLQGKGKQDGIHDGNKEKEEEARIIKCLKGNKLSVKENWVASMTRK